MKDKSAQMDRLSCKPFPVQICPPELMRSFTDVPPLHDACPELTKTIYNVISSPLGHLLVESIHCINAEISFNECLVVGVNMATAQKKSTKHQGIVRKIINKCNKSEQAKFEIDRRRQQQHVRCCDDRQYKHTLTKEMQLSIIILCTRISAPPILQRLSRRVKNRLSVEMRHNVQQGFFSFQRLNTTLLR